MQTSSADLTQALDNPALYRELLRRLIKTRSDPAQSQTLVSLAVAGDSRALHHVFENLRDHLCNRVKYELSKRHLYLTLGVEEDLIQDALIQIWQVDLKRFDATKSSLSTFATHRFRWMLIDCIRKKARCRTVSLDGRRDAGIPEKEAPRADPISRLEDAAFEQAIVDVVPKLLAGAAANNDDMAYKVVLRHDVDGVALNDIAREVRRHPANVTRARKRALRYAHFELKRTTVFFAA